MEGLAGLLIGHATSVPVATKKFWLRGIRVVLQSREKRKAKWIVYKLSHHFIDRRSRLRVNRTSQLGSGTRTLLSRLVCAVSPNGAACSQTSVNTAETISAGP